MSQANKIQIKISSITTEKELAYELWADLSRQGYQLSIEEQDLDFIEISNRPAPKLAVPPISAEFFGSIKFLRENFAVIIAFIGGAIASGFFGQIGNDSYIAVKKKLIALIYANQKNGKKEKYQRFRNTAIKIYDRTENPYYALEWYFIIEEGLNEQEISSALDLIPEGIKFVSDALDGELLERVYKLGLRFSKEENMWKLAAIVEHEGFPIKESSVDDYAYDAEEKLEKLKQKLKELQEGGTVEELSQGIDFVMKEMNEINRSLKAPR